MKIEDALKTDKFRDESHKAILNLIYTSYWLSDNIKQTTKPFGITTEQFNVLRILRGSLPKSLCVKDIKERMIEKSSNVPRILDRLERKQYIIRQQSEVDKREIYVIITKKAIALLKSMDEVVADVESKLLNIEKEEAIFLNHILEKIRDSER
jgi:DNA-binding MarR family transcriptional regulator